MDKRAITKWAVKMVVCTVIGSLITTTLETKLPATRKLHVADMTGALVGKIGGEKLETYTDKLVDDFFDRRAAAKKI